MNRTNKEIDELHRQVEKACNTLMEHCDSVQILTSVQVEGNETARSFWGRGSFYARTGMAHEFLSRDNALNIGIAVDEQTTKEEE